MISVEGLGTFPRYATSPLLKPRHVFECLVMFQGKLQEAADSDVGSDIF